MDEIIVSAAEVVQNDFNISPSRHLGVGAEAELMPNDVQRFTAAAIELLADEDKPDTVKVFNLLKALDDLVLLKSREQPYLTEIGERADAIAKAFGECQKTAEEALRELEKLIAELKEAQV